MKDGRLEIRLLGPLEMRREGQALCELLHDGPADPRAALRWSLELEQAPAGGQ